MARYTKVSSIGARPVLSDIDIDYSQTVEKVISYWKHELDQVLPDKPDIIVLPEGCDRPLNYPKLEKEKTEYYKNRGNQMLEFFSNIALNNNCYIAYSAIREAGDGTLRNSTQIIDRTGKVVGIYNKNYVVIEETTESGILCGKDAPIIDCDFGRVACAICFDLNFDELRLRYVKAKPDIILFSSMYHGGLMQNYWAYSCRSYFAGCVAGLQNTIISPVGEIIASSTNYHDFVTAMVNLDYCVVHLDYNWEKLKRIKAKYGPKVKLTDPGYLGSVMLSSETDEFTISDITKEFEIELLDDYMRRALAHNNNKMNVEP
ncbi:MAG TPA: carbon-nitrogen hydrolase family protein [Clostridiales bacterium]|nr:carbon-nitrogen hydrolase family protein [Clostridiales bacterium]